MIEDVIEQMLNRRYIDAARGQEVRQTSVPDLSSLPPLSEVTWDNCPIGQTPDRLINVLHRQSLLGVPKETAAKSLGVTRGMLTILNEDPRDALGTFFYHTRCSCGRTRWLTMSDISERESMRAGCMHDECQDTSVAVMVQTKARYALALQVNRALYDAPRAFDLWKDTGQGGYDGLLWQLCQELYAMTGGVIGMHWVDMSVSASGEVSISSPTFYPRRPSRFTAPRVCLDQSGKEGWVPLSEAAEGLGIAEEHLFRQSLLVAPWQLVDNLED